MSDNSVFFQVARGTHLLDESALDNAPAMPVRATGPLDAVLPWVIELRVVGTTATLQVRVTEYMTIGRADPEHNIVPAVDLGPYNGYGLGVSRQHAAILASGNSIRVKDTGSANGTRLNGCLLEPHREYRLRHGDELALGQLKLQVLFAVVPLVTDSRHLPDNDRSIPRLGSGQRVLVVEDDADVAAVFGMILEQAGFQVQVVNTAASALGAIAADAPQAVVLDLMLPDINGLDLMHYLRQAESGFNAPLVVVSGQTGGFLMSEALKAGADVFLGKPVGVSELIGAFTTILPQMTP